MKILNIALVIFTLAQSSLWAGPPQSVEVTAEDVAIGDRALEKKLLKRVQKDGTITSSRMGVDSYILAVLCEYPAEGNKKFRPYCSFRKVEVKTQVEAD